MSLYRFASLVAVTLFLTCFTPRESLAQQRLEGVFKCTKIDGVVKRSEGETGNYELIPQEWELSIWEHEVTIKGGIFGEKGTELLINRNDDYSVVIASRHGKYSGIDGIVLLRTENGLIGMYSNTSIKYFLGIKVDCIKKDV